MVSRALHLGLRGLQLLWTVLIVALIGNMIASATAGNPAVVNYNMFAAVFAFLSLLYLLPTTFKPDLGIPIVTVVLDALNVLFLFCGAVAQAAYLGVHSCGNQNYIKSNFITNGSPNMSGRCHEAQASTAFLWFNWATFVATLVVVALANRGGVNMRGGLRRGGPSMSQV